MNSKVNHLEEATAPWNPSPIAFKLATKKYNPGLFRGPLSKAGLICMWGDVVRE